MSDAIRRKNLFCAEGREGSTVALLILYLLVYCGQTLWAQGGPPLLTDDPSTPGDGNWEINIAFTAQNRRTEKSYEIPILDINYGLGERIQLKYEVPWVVLDKSEQGTKNGLGRSEFGLKWRFLDQQRKGIDMSIYPQLAFPNSSSTVSRGLVERGLEFVLPCQVEKSFGRISFNPELGYVFKEYDSNEWLYGCAFGYHVSSCLELLAEIYGTTEDDFANDELLFNLGGRLKLSERHTLFIAVGRSFRSSSSREPEFLGYLGMQFNF